MTKRLLIIEDDPDIQEILCYVFVAEGYEVMLSIDGGATRELDELIPDLILMDVQLKAAEKNGDAICLWLKSNSSTRNYPIILLSAEQDLGAISRACFADAYLSKPFDIAELTGMVKRMIGSP